MMPALRSGWRSTRSELDAFCEQLEPRRLLATYSLAEYLPLNNGEWFDYSARVDGRTVSARESIVGDPASRDGAQLCVSYRGSGASGDDCIRLKVDSNGIYQSGQIADNSGSGLKYSFTPALRLLPSVFSDGGRYTVNSRGLIEPVPANGQSATGTVVGETIVVGAQKLTTPAGTFPTVHTRTRLHLSFRATDGSTLEADLNTDWWLTRRIGFVRVDLTGRATVDGDTDTTEASLVLTGSSLLRRQPQAIVLGGSARISDGDSTPSEGDRTMFADLRIGDVQTRTFTIRNTHSSTPLHITGVTLRGRQARDFAIVSGGGNTTVAPGRTATISVRFNPKAVGVRQTTLHLNCDDPDNGDYDFRIRGRAEPGPEISVTGGGVAIDSGDATPRTRDSTAFGAVAVGSIRDRTFVITNTGAVALRFLGDSPVSVAGRGASSFVLISGPSASLAPGESVSLTLRFAPASKGARNAVVRISSDDVDESAFSFAVSGAGR